MSESVEQPELMRSRSLPGAVLSLSVLACTATLAGQVAVRAERVVLVDQAGGGVASGAPVQMFESPNLDRYLRKAQDLIGREDFAGAIKVLQDIVEGRTLFDNADEVAPQKGEAPKPDDRLPVAEDDPTHAVFSSDSRLYRPVRRLCQELLAALPPDGIALYREQYEAQASALLQRGLATRDVHALAEVYDRFFVTRSAAQAMSAAGDLLMHSGRFRGAIQTFRTLLEVYPAASRSQVPGFSDVYLAVKMAMCFLQLGERSKAAEELERLAREHPDASVRIMGELVGVADLANSELFAGAVLAPVRPTAQVSALRGSGDQMSALWEHRFAEPSPYKPLAQQQTQRVFFATGQEAGSGAAPRPRSQAPGASVAFDEGRVVFMDHFELRVHDLGSGLTLVVSDGSAKMTKPDPTRARQRYAVYDQVAQRVVIDDDHYYTVIGHNAAGGAMTPILRNELVAYDRRTMASRWSTEDWHTRGSATTGDYRDVTFLAAPTVFGRRLLVPVLIRDVYALQCIDATSGEPLFRAHLHHGGTDLARAPSVPVSVHMGIAFVLTNAGTVAAIDAFTGNTLWIRKYEREHPLRPPPPTRQRGAVGVQFPGNVYREVALDGFAPSDLIVVEGRVIAAPTDGDVLLCLDGASGEILWLLSKPERDTYLVGHNSRHLFMAGSENVTCVDLRSGVRLWNERLPRPGGWNGRGFVTESLIAMPGERCFYTLDVSGGPTDARTWRSTDLTPAAVGSAPLDGQSNLFAAGAYVAVCFEAGVAVFGCLPVLQELAQATDEPGARATLLVQAGELEAAVGVLEGSILDASRPQADRSLAVRRALALALDVAMTKARRAEREPALAMLARCEAWSLGRDLRLQLQLARVEVLRELGDRQSADAERETLYAMMEGRK